MTKEKSNTPKFMVSCLDDELEDGVDSDNYVNMEEEYHNAIIFVDRIKDDGQAHNAFKINHRFPPEKAEELASEIGILHPERIFRGGPNNPGMGFVVHREDYKNESTYVLLEGEPGNRILITFGMTILVDIASGKGPSDYRLYLGHCGPTVTPTNEICTNGVDFDPLKWHSVEATAADFMSEIPKREKWEKLLRRCIKEKVEKICSPEILDE